MSSQKPDEDFDYIVTPFPESIGKLLHPNNPYLIWIILSAFLLIYRIGTMLLCGEEVGRIPINILSSLLPGTLAILIIIYSKSVEKMTKHFCCKNEQEDSDKEAKGTCVCKEHADTRDSFQVKSSDENAVKKQKKEEKEIKKRQRIIEWCESRTRFAFNDRWMVLSGIIFALIFSILIPMEGKQLYPTPEHNIRHREIIRDKHLVNLRKSWQPLNANEPLEEIWTQIPLGKAIQLIEEKRHLNVLKSLSKDPDPCDRGILSDEKRDEKLIAGTALCNEFKSDNATDAQVNDMENGKRLHPSARGQNMIWPLRIIYLTHNNDTLWAYSARAYEVVMIFLYFMSGALLWSLFGIVQYTRKMGKNKDIKTALKLDPFPHPMKSIKAVGRTLWLMAVNHGVIYTVAMICLYFARPDTISLTVACLFSLVVVAIFITPQYNLHKLMIKVKYAKMTPLNKHLDDALQETQKNPNIDNLQRAQGILELQEGLAKTCEWPCNLKGYVTVLGSVLIPLLMAAFSIYEHFQ